MSTGRQASTARLGAALFLQGASVLSLEIILARLLAVAMWHHFSSLAISLALLGSAVGALLVQRRLSHGRATAPAKAALAAGLGAAAVFAAVAAVSLFPRLGQAFLSVFHHPFYEPFAAPMSPLAMPLYLAAFSLVAAAPFAASGYMVAAIFAENIHSAGTVYAANLLGSGFGCFLAVATLNAFDGVSALLIAGLPALAGAWLLGRGRRFRLYCAAIALLMAVAALSNAVAPFARLSFVRGRYQPDIIYEAWDAASRLLVYPVSGVQAEGSWGQSRRHLDEVPPQMGMVVDDTGYTTLTRFPADGNLEFMRHNLISLPYVIRGGASALIIGPGGGKDILAALANGAKDITAVEINPLLVKAVDGVLGDFSGRLYSRPTVTTHVAEGRSFLRGHRAAYDILQASLVYGRLPSSAGAYTLTEEHLYTLESFREYLGHLRDDGLLAVTRFIYEKRIVRLAALARSALEEAGSADPRRHIFMAAERGLATMLVKRTPFKDDELKELNRWCRDLDFQVLFSPEQTKSNAFQKLLDAPSLKYYLNESRFDLTPPGDDRPYFYYLLKRGDFWRTLAGRGDYDFEDKAILIVRNALMILGLFSLGLIAAPVGRHDPALRIYSFGYFGCLALGFIIVEIVLLKQLILYLGYPTLSLSVVLAAVLLSAGLGSRLGWTVMGPAAPRRLAVWLIVLIGVIAVYPVIGTTVVENTLARPLWFKITVAVLGILPIGMLMGAPFAAGLTILGRRNSEMVPWAIGVNGAFSVLGAMAAVLMALNYGFRITLLLAAAAYALALLCLWRLAPREGR